MDIVCGLCVSVLLGIASACNVAPDLFISSLKLEGLSGSCLLIPCTFTLREKEKFPGEESKAVWIKTQSQFLSENSDFVVFNGSRRSPNYPMTIIGDLNRKNCTTVFNKLEKKYTDKYFFRAEDGKFKSTASCNPIDITITDSPWSPSLKVTEQTDTEMMITCSALTPCPDEPPRLTWSLHQSPASKQSNPDGTFNTTLSHRLAVKPAPGGCTVSCSAEYNVNGALKKVTTAITLNVECPDSVKADALVKWLPAVCVIVLIALVGTIVYIWYVKFRRQKLQPAQVQVIEDSQHEQSQIEDGLHYGDIMFNPRRPQPVCSAQEETVYSQVKVSDNKTRSAADTTDIYAQVRK